MVKVLEKLAPGIFSGIVNDYEKPLRKGKPCKNVRRLRPEKGLFAKNKKTKKIILDEIDEICKQKVRGLCGGRILGKHNFLHLD